MLTSDSHHGLWHRFPQTIMKIPIHPIAICLPTANTCSSLLQPFIGRLCAAAVVSLAAHISVIDLFPFPNTIFQWSNQNQLLPGLQSLVRWCVEPFWFTSQCMFNPGYCVHLKVVSVTFTFQVTVWPVCKNLHTLSAVNQIFASTEPKQKVANRLFFFYQTNKKKSY